MTQVTIGDKIIEILTKTQFSVGGLTPESFNWSSDIPNFDDIIDWLILTVTEDNYVTREDLLLFNQHKKNNKILSDEELNRELSLYMTSEEGFPPTQVEIDDLASRITEIQDQIKDLHTLSAMISDELKIVKNKITKMQKLKKEKDEKVKKQVEKYKNYCTEFTTALSLFENKLDSVWKNVSSIKDENHGDSYLINQNLDEYLSLNKSFEVDCDCAKRELEKILSHDSELFRNLSSVPLNNTINNTLNTTMLQKECNSYFTRHISRASQGVQLAEMSKVVYKCKNQGLQGAINFLKNIEKEINDGTFSTSLSDMRKFVVEYRPEEPWLDRTKLEQVCYSYTMGLLSEFEGEEKTNKKSRKEYKLRLVTRLSEALKGRRNNNLLLYCMLKHELAMVRAAQIVVPECLASVNSVEERFRRRIEWMKSEMSKKPVEMVYRPNEFFRSLGMMLTGDEEIAKYFYKEDAVKHIKNLDQNLDKSKEHLIDYAQEKSKSVYKILAGWKSVEKHLFVGATRQVTFVSPEMRERMRLMKRHASKIYYRLEKFHHKINSHKESLKDPLVSKRHYAWKDFLQNPGKMVSEILSIEEDAKVLSEEAEFKLREHHRDFRNYLA